MYKLSFQKLSLQRYFPLVTEDQLLNNDKRFQQIMQGSSSADTVWPEKHKFEKIDVKKEISKLNISKFSFKCKHILTNLNINFVFCYCDFFSIRLSIIMATNEH